MPHQNASSLLLQATEIRGSWSEDPAGPSRVGKKIVKGSQSQYFQLFWPHIKLLLNRGNMKIIVY